MRFPVRKENDCYNSKDRSNHRHNFNYIMSRKKEKICRMYY